MPNSNVTEARLISLCERILDKLEGMQEVFPSITPSIDNFLAGEGIISREVSDLKSMFRETGRIFAYSLDNKTYTGGQFPIYLKAIFAMIKQVYEAFDVEQLDKVLRSEGVHYLELVRDHKNSIRKLSDGVLVFAQQDMDYDDWTECYAYFNDSLMALVQLIRSIVDRILEQVNQGN